MMKSLKYFRLFGCIRLEKFPNIPQEMDGLKVLDLFDIAIRELPPSFGNLIGLEQLYLSSNFCSIHLPSSIYKLQHLHLPYLFGGVEFLKDVEISRQALSYGGFSNYGFQSLNFLFLCCSKNCEEIDFILTSCCPPSLKRLSVWSKDISLPESINRFSSLHWLEIRDCMFVEEIPKLPKSVREVDASNCFSLDSHSIQKLLLQAFLSLYTKYFLLPFQYFTRFAKCQFLEYPNCMQFGRMLRLPKIMTCLGVKGDILLDSQSSTRLSPTEFSIIQTDLTQNYVDDDARCEYQIILPGNEIPKKFNHQSVNGSISFWIGPEFPTFALCLAFCLDGMRDTDTYSYICVVDIFINGHKRLLRQRLFDNLECGHLWFYGVPHSQLQQEFRDLLQGDQNLVDVSCKISNWTSKTGGENAPIIARMGIHVECICHPQNSIIISENYELVQPQNRQISKRIVHQRLRPFLNRGPSFILRRLYHTQCPIQSTSRRQLLKARKIHNSNSSKRKGLLVAKSCICLYGAQEHGLCSKELGSTYLEGLTSVQSSNSDSRIRDMPIGEPEIPKISHSTQN